MQFFLENTPFSDQVGLVPRAEFFLENTPLLYPRVTKAPCNEDLEVLEMIQMTDRSIQRFLQAYPEWRRNHWACIHEAQKLADKMDTYHHVTKLTHVGTSVFRICTDAVLILAGLALIPVSGGASLGLTIAGVAGSSAATVIQNVASKVDALQQKKCLEKARNILKHDKDMRKILHQLNCNATKVVAFAAKGILRRLLEATQGEGELLRSYCKTNYIPVKLLYNIKDIADSVPFSEASFNPIEAATCVLKGECALEALEVCSEDYVSGGFRILIEGAKLVEDISSLSKGSLASEKLKRAIIKMFKEIEYVDHMYRILHRC